ARPAELAAALAPRVLLSERASRPLAACARRASELARRSAEQRGTPFHRDPGEVDELASIAGELTRFDWNAEARALAAPGALERLPGLLARALEVGCHVAVSEGAFGSPPCPRGGPTPGLRLPAPRGALAIALGSRLGEVRWGTSAEGDAFAIASSAATTNLRVSGSWLSVRRGAERAEERVLATPTGAGAPLAPPMLAWADGAPRFALTLTRDASGRTRGALSRVDGATDVATSAGALDELPAGFALGVAGAPLFVRAGAPVLALTSAAPDAEGGALLTWSAPDRPASLFTGLPGRLIAAWSPGTPLLVTARERDEGTALAVRPADALPAPSLADALVPGATRPRIGDARACGERLFFTMTSGEKTWLIVAGSSQIVVTALSARAGAALAVVCGGCAPEVLERSDQGLRLLAPRGATREVPIAAAADTAALASARAACTAEATVVAMIARGAVLVAHAPAGQGFAPPVPVAEPNAEGAPAELDALAVGRRLVLVWRRATPRPREVALELLESDDGAAWR
ncbi:MAG: hypothetical protein OZ921_15275, partial [Sorangiineae bacterium]|nr:hypothetical protein [Sorangiineae bacterium]